MTDYTKMTDGEMMLELGMDATKWADAFMQLAKGRKIDEEVMLGWFAAAIMTGHDMAHGGLSGVVCGDAVDAVAQAQAAQQ